jgi:hypothetical protein
MPRKPLRAKLRDGKYNLVIQIPGWFKNEILDHCRKHGVGINVWVSATLLRALREERGMPPAPDPVARIPTTADEIRSYVIGEKLTQPCGRTDCKPQWKQLQNMKFCEECGVRGT